LQYSGRSTCKKKDRSNAINRWFLNVVDVLFVRIQRRTG